MPKGSIFNPKNGIASITYEGKNITDEVTITASSVETSTEGEKNVTYTIKYKDKQIQVSGKVNVSTTCTE